ncbi:hypothetical protein P154DRAFT_298296 [Amniculicola lignicola CBS 123094]|uniref:Uncharacterized protein n=1 Tax=Amniculicola lignicola CBS 123094 TaxID=1392246 RepID=A0A6A5WD60_9PLEO|nr:hypothetical protein P154DRAFT_298296 [Amniculicola lignicola CBS 123094]
MPNVLVLSFEGFSFSSRQLYEQLLPKLLSRAVVHESQSFQDASSYITSGWPSIILVTDPVITFEEKNNLELLQAVADYTKQGCTTILMGLFAAAVEYPRLDTIFREYFDLRWRAGEYTRHDIHLLTLEESMIRSQSLAHSFRAKALFLSRVPAAQMVYVVSMGVAMSAYGAFARVGLGKLGYVGDVNFTEEPERLILAMCHLDRPEDDYADPELIEQRPMD